ncbi:hypothetical protein KJ660_03275, partial [Candidatus Micrarchaeota archaeon]|nr:hypothetical protein [Candidatus Micrarchaeota archaeon]
MNEEKPRELSPEERVQKSRVKEDVDIFDEVFDGKKEKHVEEIIKTIKPEKENTAFEKSSGAKAEAFEKSIGAKEKKENKSIEKEIELEENEEAEEENIEEPEEELKKELPPKNELKKLILRKALKSATKEIEEEVEEEKEERGETISEMEGAPEPEEKFVEEVPANSMPLQFLEDEKNESVFIGRKKSVFLNYGSDAALLIGRLEEEGYNKKKVFLDGLNPHVVFVCGARGSGKCLTGDSLITLEDGSVIPIKELENNDKRVLGLNHELKVVPLKKEGFYKRKVSKLLYLRLRSGREIKLTPEHPLLTINGWMQTQELKAKDRIAVPRALNVFGNTRMRECDIKLLAYFIAEGHLRNAFVLFSNEDKKILEDFSQSIKEFDENLRIEVHSKIGCYRVAQKKKPIDLTNVVRNKKGQFTSKGFIVAQKSSLAKWFESIGLYGKLTKEKVIPEEVLKLPKEQLALFLNRLFSCDGSIHPISRRKNNWQVSYSSSSDKMIRQVQNLLIRFGILSRLRFKKVKCNEKKFNSFELVISSESVIRFIQEIGFFGVKELKQENAIKDMLEVSRNPNVDTIPKEIWGIYRPKNCKAASRAMGYNPNYVHSSLTYAPSRKKLLRMAQIEGNKGVQMIAESDIFWDEVTELKEIPGEDVYDISVPEYYNFVANDIIVHNSYVLGVIAEELALKNSNVGIVVIDPIGVFWSMKYANKEEKELSALIEWGLEPQGLDNLKVFIPAGMKNETPKNTYDATFSIQPSLLTSEDWCLTFGMERFGPSGLLLDKVIKKVEHGYKTIEGKYVKANKQGFSLDGMINCLETDEELNSRERGYKQDSIRALVSRFEAAKSWGIFDEKGTPLGELSRENQLTVL